MVCLLLNLLHVLALLERLLVGLIIHILNLAWVHILELLLITLLTRSNHDPLAWIMTAASSLGLPRNWHVLVILFCNRIIWILSSCDNKLVLGIQNVDIFQVLA